MCHNVKILLPCKFVSFLKKTGRAVFPVYYHTEQSIIEYQNQL